MFKCFSLARVDFEKKKGKYKKGFVFNNDNKKLPDFYKTLLISFNSKSEAPAYTHVHSQPSVVPIFHNKFESKFQSNLFALRARKLLIEIGVSFMV